MILIKLIFSIPYYHRIVSQTQSDEAVLHLTGCTFEGGEVEAFCKTSVLDYPRDPTTDDIAAAVHPQLQVERSLPTNFGNLRFRDDGLLFGRSALSRVLVLQVLSSLSLSLSLAVQDNDFKLLRPGDPIFQSFNGETVKYEGEEAYPFFVNECAYYEKKIAFQLARKISISLPSISVTKD